MRRASLAITIVVGAVAALLSSDVARTQERAGEPARDTIEGTEVAPREALVVLRRPLQRSELQLLRAHVDADRVAPLGRGRMLRLRSRSLDALTLLAFLNAHPDIAHVEPNYLVRRFDAPDDPGFPQLWGLQNLGQVVNGHAGQAGADIHAPAAWASTTGSPATVVGIVDTGIDYTHPDLAPNVWSAPSAFTVTIAGVTLTCPQGSHGFNAIAMSCDPMDDHTHGTHVAGTIGAAGNNALGVVGVNWTTRMMGLKFLDASGAGTVADAVNAIEFALQARAAFAPTGAADVRVLSNSWGGAQFSQALLDEILAAGAENVLFVAAAGNSGRSNDVFPTFPASYAAPNIVAVAATTNIDTRASFSNFGASSVHLGAPGVDILSTVIGGSYAFLSGTSMATPHVSGAAALVLSRCALDTPALKQTLLDSAEPVAALATATITGGRLDANAALRACTGPPDAPTGIAATGGNATVVVTWVAAEGATRYIVKRSQSPGGPYVAVANGVKGVEYSDASVVNGTTYYYVVAAANTVGESGNSSEASATPLPPHDLVVSALSVPSSGGAGAPLLVSETTRNLGSGASGPSITRFYLSTNAAWDAADVPLVGTHAVPSLAPGDSSSATVTLTLPPTLAAGVYYVIAKADADAVLNETQRSNNTAVRLMQIGPDLVVAALNAPTTAAPGGTVTVTDSVKNQGAGAAGASVTRFYLSANGAFDAADILLPGSRAVTPLAAGSTDTGSTALILPSPLAAGTYYLIAKADADNTVGESQEINNTALRAIQVGGDLVVSALSVPSRGAAGGTITISDTTANTGAGGVPPSVTRFYLSANPLLDAGDVVLAGSHAVPDLAAGAAHTASTIVAIPPSIGAGTYYVIAKADADNAVAEPQETNNTALRTIQIGGDLVVSSLTVPLKAAAGATIAVADVTSNQGAGPVPESITRFYLSTNALADEGDILLSGSRAVPALSALGVSAGSTPVVIPPSVNPGSYFLMAKADADEAVAEAQETNNSAARTILIGPDLMVSNLVAPATIVAGASVAITDVIANQGADTAGPSATRFYLSQTLALDPAAQPLPGSRPVPAIGPGASSTGSTIVTVPSGTPPGSYFLFAKADADQTVGEAQETNNTIWRLMQVTAGP
jgi:subtilisin family serine protease